MTLAAGTRLGPYEIVSPLGAGDSAPMNLVVNWTADLKR